MKPNTSIKPPPPGTCQLLGPVSIVIQSLMGVLVIMVLLLKRNYEHPKRKMIVWVYDITKQVGGSLVIHFLNIGISILKRKKRKFLMLAFNKIIVNLNVGENNYDDEGDEENADQCDWYFLNLLMDTTFGIPILWVALKVFENIANYYQIENVESGNYFCENISQEDDAAEPREQGNTPCVTKTINSLIPCHHDKRKIYHDERHPLFIAFFKQFIVFIIGLIIMKFCIFLILNYFEDFASWFANLVLGWSDPWPNFQVFLVMFVSPVLLNCFQYCCVDNIIKLHHVNLQNIDNFEPTEEEQIFDEIDRENHGNSNTVNGTGSNSSNSSSSNLVQNIFKKNNSQSPFDVEQPRKKNYGSIA